MSRSDPQSSADEESVAVVVPVYNGEDHLADALDSVLEQTMAPEEIIVVDDGSTDRSAEVAAAVPDVRVIRQSNAGPGPARRRGVQESSADVLVFLDADDVLLPTALEIGVTQLRQHPDCAAVAGRAVDVEGVQRHGSSYTGPVTYEMVLAGHSFVPPSSLAVRRRALTAVGGWSDRRLAEDLDLYLRLVSWGPIWAHGHGVTRYRRHADNSTNDLGRLLPACLSVLDDQRSRIVGDARLEAALERGRDKWVGLFGPMLPGSAARQLLSGEVAGAWRTLAVALRHAPASLARYPLQLLGRVARSVVARLRSAA